MATSIIKPVHAGIDFSFTIAAADWSSTSPYTYTWTNSAVTDGCRVEVEFASSSANTEVMYLSYEKISGGVTFTAPVLPTTAIVVVVHVINAQTGNTLAVTDEMVSSDVISGAANVNEALTILNGNIAKETVTFTKSASCPTTYEAPKLYKINKTMYFSVVFNSTLPTTQTNVIGNIPDGYRPNHRVAGNVAITNSGTGALIGYGALRIGPSGAVEIAVSVAGFTECTAVYEL